MMDPLKITMDGKIYQATLIDNPLSKQILELCPFEVEFQRSGNYEYYSILPDKVSHSGVVDVTSKAEKNKLYYFEGWNALSIVFGDKNIEPFKIVQLGDFDEEILPQLHAGGSIVHISFEVDV